STHKFLSIELPQLAVKGRKNIYYLSMTMAKNFSSSAQLLLVLLVTMAFVSGILARGTPSRCSGARQESCPSIPGQGN
ncbi:unnamed protein product, partial [Urochloa humidicola]